MKNQQKKKRCIVCDGVTKEELAELKELLGVEEDYEPTPHTEKDVYDAINGNKLDHLLPPHVLIVEKMKAEGIDENHPMYEQLMEQVHALVAHEMERIHNVCHWINPNTRIALTKLEFVLAWYDFVGVLEDKNVIPKEYEEDYRRIQREAVVCF